MRLRNVSMAGFKSFADKTVFKLDGDITGVVGPNGCGKSNIVDAVRWVMGESRASQLRQEVSADIIFNGSSSRRPHDLCTVEMNLANDSGRDLGMWSEYAEISLKRQLERDGESQYFINGQRVRRRDVTDLLAGTGSGARSYGLVEQEQVTQIVQADPKRVRAHLEEAAGIATYKERRRATERRMVSTEENLARLADIAKELERQMASLARQAKQTIRVRKYKQELDEMQRLEMWQRHDILRTASDAAATTGKELATVLDKCRAAVAKVEGELAKTREQRAQAGAHQAKQQAAHFDAQAKVERVRQRQREFNLLLEKERQQLTQAEQAGADHDQTIAQLGATIKELDKSVATIDAEAAARTRSLDKAREILQATATARDEARTAVATAEETLNNVAAQRQQATSRLELETQRDSDLAGEVATAQQELANLAPVATPDTAALAKLRTATEQARGKAVKQEARRQDLAAQAAAAREEQVLLQARSGALAKEAELLGALADERDARRARDAGWLARQGAASDDRPLAEQAEIVVQGCEQALDAVLGHVLDGHVVDGLPQVAAHGDLPDGITLLERQASKSATMRRPPAGLVPLRDKVRTHADWQGALSVWLHGAYLAETHQAAVDNIGWLEPGELVVTATGHVFRPGVLVAQRPRETGLAWAARRKAVDKEIAQVGKQVDKAGAEVTRLDGEIEQAKQAGERLATVRKEHEDRLAEALSEQSRLEHAARFRAEQEKRLQGTLTRLAAGRTERGTALAAARANLDKVDKEHKRCAAELDKAQAKVAAAITKHDTKREEVVELERQAGEAAIKSEHGRQRIGDMQTRVEELRKAKAETGQLVKAIQQRIKSMGKGNFDHELGVATKAEADRAKDLEAAQAEVDRLAATETGQEEQLAQARTSLDQAGTRHREQELDATSKATEAKAVERQLAELGGAPATLDELRTKFPTADVIVAHVDRLRKRIEQAGPVNYAADAEHAACERRMAENKVQADDLEQALATLKTAIKRIDEEMLARLDKVFSALNEGFGKLFTKLFDGGSASISIVGDSLLTDGIEIKASPPGKRVSNIQSLSGGEKTLTALAFLFALNELNPPPFVILDEVDAALDEANTRRFCRLVTSMGEGSQFIIITHNKLVIESADRLVGVTQEERGVSKLVSVLVEEAVANAQAAAVE